MRDGATAALADNAYTGIQAVKYDGTNDGQLVFGKDGVARVGDIGNTQPLATRAEKDALTDGHLLQWDAAGQTLIDSNRTVGEFARVEGDNTFTGANTFTDSIVIQGEANTVGLNVSDPSNPAILTRILRHQISVTDSSNGMKVSLCSAGKLTVQDSSTSAKYQPGKITYNGKDLLFPETEAGGTFALTKDLPEANPTAAGTVTLTKLKVGDVVYTIPSGGSGGVTSVTTSGTGNAVTAASISGDTLTLTKGSTFALITDIPDTSSFVTLSGAQTISGNKTFNNHISLHYGPDGYIDFGSNWKFFGYSLNNGTGTSLSFPSGKNGTIALTSDIPIKTATLSDNGTTLTLILK